MKKRAGRVPRPKDELKQELREQLGLLRLSCESFDKGHESSGKYISLTLRILLHHHGNSRSLLEQLGLRGMRFLDTAGKLNPRNLLTECNLIGYRATDTELTCLPTILLGPPLTSSWEAFPDWWTQPVLRDQSRSTLSRFELVTHISDTDGGAHVDPELDATYMAISRANSLGWLSMLHPGAPSPPAGKPELACMRQIAHEVLSTVHEKVPEFRDAAKPVLTGADAKATSIKIEAAIAPGGHR